MRVQPLVLSRLWSLEVPRPQIPQALLCPPLSESNSVIIFLPPNLGCLCPDTSLSLPWAHHPSSPHQASNLKVSLDIICSLPPAPFSFLLLTNSSYFCISLSLFFFFFFDTACSSFMWNLSSQTKDCPLDHQGTPLCISNSSIPYPPCTRPWL